MEPVIEQGKCDAVIRSLDHGRFTIAGNRCVNSRRPQKMVARSDLLLYGPHSSVTSTAWRNQLFGLVCTPLNMCRQPSHL